MRLALNTESLGPRVYIQVGVDVVLAITYSFSNWIAMVPVAVLPP